MSEMNGSRVRLGAGRLIDLALLIPTAVVTVLGLAPGSRLSASFKDKDKAVAPLTGYRWHPGFIAWVLHRLTGLALAAYLILHLFVLHTLAKGPEAFDSIMGALTSPLTRLLEIGLMAVVAYHTINGLRVVFLDYGPLAETETYKKWVFVAFGIIGGVVLVGGIIMLVHIFGSGH